MKTLYIECNMGAAGDMLTAALLELLPERETFLNKINGAGITGVRVTAAPSVKCGITGTRVSVTVGDNSTEEISADVDMTVCRHHHDYHEHEHDGEHSSPHTHGHDHGDEHHHDHHNHEHDGEHSSPHTHGHDHGDKDHHDCHEHEHDGEHSSLHTHGDEHGHHHAHNGIRDIEALLSGLDVSDTVKKNALGIYRLIAEAESRAHGRPPELIHFHEVGSLDAVADITGVCVLMEELSPERVVVSPVHVGRGFVRCAHGVLPVPAPATAHILTGVPCYGGSVKGELCTPTGAAILKYFASDFGAMPLMTVERTGYGMGAKDFEAANCVRVFLGESGEHGAAPGEKAAELSCNIDDMTGEAVAFACGALMEAGAKDVFTTAAGMKKGRPGIILTCLCGTEEADTFAALMLKYTSTFGVRKTIVERYTLEREIQSVRTPLGNVRVKTGRGYGVTKAKPEYEDIAALARTHTISVGEAEKRIAAYLNQKETAE